MAEGGLTSDDVARRIEQFGYNQLTEAPRPGFLVLLWNQLKDIVVMLLIVASVISIFLGEIVDVAAIMAIVVLNAVLGIVQERRARSACHAHGQRLTIPGRDLVPGDIVYLEAGNFVPADVRLLEAVNLRVEEASLKGVNHWPCKIMPPCSWSLAFRLATAKTLSL